MKRRLLVFNLFCLLVFLINSIEAFEISEKGFKAGGNFSNVEGEDFAAKPKYKLGFVGGFYLLSQIDNYSSINTELLFSMKGYKIDSNDCTVDATLSYIELPVLYKRILSKGQFTDINILLGPAFSYNIYQHFDTTSFGNQISGESEPFNEFDFGVIIGFGFELSTMKVDIRYEVGLLDWSETEIYNRAISVLVGFHYK